MKLLKQLLTLTHLAPMPGTNHAIHTVSPWRYTLFSCMNCNNKYFMLYTKEVFFFFFIKLFGRCKVPGKRVLGSYALDDVKEYSPVQVPSSSEVVTFPQ